MAFAVSDLVVRLKEISHDKQRIDRPDDRVRPRTDVRPGRLGHPSERNMRGSRTGSYFALFDAARQGQVRAGCAQSEDTGVKRQDRSALASMTGADAKVATDFKTVWDQFTATR